jgi:two-component system, cell cycle response regulator
LVLVLGDTPDGWEDHLQNVYALTHATDQGDLLLIAEARHPDAIVVCSPEGEVAMLLEILSRSEDTRTIPVILVSDDIDPDDRAIAIENGACDLISAGSSPRELSARITSATRASEQLRNLREGLSIDPVTGLPDRRQLFHRLEEEIDRSRRHAHPLALVIIETDNLDDIVAAKGPSASEGVISQIAVVLRNALRKSDAAFRYQGDSFTLLLPETGISEAQRVADRALDLITAINYEEGVTLSIDTGADLGVRASAGIAELEPGRTPNQFIAKAEAALRFARASGGGMSWRADDPRRSALNAEALAENLTVREWSVLAQLARRKTEQEIALRLGIQTGTVRSHKARIRRKLNISANARLSDYAEENFSDLVHRAGIDLEVLELE